MDKLAAEHFTSIDKPYLRHMPKFIYDEDASKKTAMEFVRDSAIRHSSSYLSLKAFNFYGHVIRNQEFFMKATQAGNAFLNSGETKDSVIPMFCLNTPETFEIMYGLNDFGIATEWFNPNAVTTAQLHKHLVEEKVTSLVIIDLMYPKVKEAIKGTDVKQVIITSVMDSFPKTKSLLYQLQVLGIRSIVENPYFKHVIESIDGIIPSERQLNSVPDIERRKTLNKYQKILFKINEYAKKERILAKASFYKDDSKDERFILWQDFIDKFGDVNRDRQEGYQEGKVKFIVHTGGTTGPAKRVAMTDFACNSSVYQTTLMPMNDFNYEDSFCQLCPPMVAYSLEGMHLARYYQMYTHLIATYDRTEFPQIMLKTRANHYFAVPSFVKTLIEDPKWLKKEFSFVKSVNHGGEAINEEVEKQVDKVLGGKSRHGYGQNEEFGGVIFNYNIPGIPKKYGTCGFPLPGTDYIIFDKDAGKELPYGYDDKGKPYIGELLLSTNASMLGYINEAPEVTEKAFCYYNGKRYIDTGDEAYIDKEGRLCFWTREQRIIRTQSGKIFVNILEDIINEIPEVVECCVVKSPHPSNVAEASCHIVLKPECFQDRLDETINKIITTVEEKTKSMYFYYTPGTYEFRSERLPLTPFGKVAYRELEESNEQEYNNNQRKALKKIRIKS